MTTMLDAVPPPQLSRQQCDYFTKTGWTKYVTTPYMAKPTLPSLAEYRAMRPAARARLNNARKAWMREMPPVKTKELLRIHGAAMRLVNSNQGAIGPARHLAIDAPETRTATTTSKRRGHDGGVSLRRRTGGGIGKSITAISFGRHYWHVVDAGIRSGQLARPDLRRLPGLYGADAVAEFHPVAVIGMQSSGRSKDLNKEILRFYDAPIGRPASTGDLTNVCKTVARACGTRVIIVDDVDWLLGQSPSAVEAMIKHVKDLGSRLGVTFIFTGIGLEERGFFDDSQLGTRCKRLTMEPYSATRDGTLRWQTLLKALDRQMVLLDPRQSLVDLWPHLYELTSGYLASLRGLLYEATEVAIDRGEERLSATLLEEVGVDAIAEARRARARQELGALHHKVTSNVISSARKDG